ncbi:hypothetical protein NFI96_033114 [Prochilodus magdalenae]|nr:hypothetical protein NFI96_033114 [Prochilodus magdalenae]
MLRTVRVNPQTSTKDLQHDLAADGVTVHRSTVQRTLHKEMLYGRVMQRKPFLHPLHKQSCLSFNINPYLYTFIPRTIHPSQGCFRNKDVFGRGAGRRIRTPDPYFLEEMSAVCYRPKMKKTIQTVLSNKSKSQDFSWYGVSLPVSFAKAWNADFCT